MTIVKSCRHRSLNLFDGNKKHIHFIINGQYTFLFANKENKTLSFDVYDSERKQGLKIEFNKKSVKINRLPNLESLKDKNNKQGLSSKKGAYYWVSIDAQNQKIQAGIGEARIENVIYCYSFPRNKEEERKQNKLLLESLTTIDLFGLNIIPLQLLKDPIMSKVPLLVKDTDELTMDDIANASYLSKSHLSLDAQQLYHCISGKNFILDSYDFPDFSKAIEYSISTPGLWCFEKLKDKSREFNKDKPNILETYLRITLNENNGESPGVPYVMEIWPVGHFSPVHSHSNANAVIRVLHGKINVKLFAFLCDEEDTIEPFIESQFVKDDITWISPILNQVHKLENLETNTETCITIQCYKYDEKDSTHYDYFYYLDSQGQKKQYEPDSDMDFIAFKEKMKQEWSSINSEFIKIKN